MDFGSFLRRLGKNVRRARWAAGFTQAQLAAKGISFRYLGEIERGERNPSVETLFILARHLGVTPALLLDVDPAGTERARDRLDAATIEPPKRGRKPSAVRARQHRPTRR